MDDYLQNIQVKRQQSTDDQNDANEKYQHLLEIEDIKSSIQSVSDIISTAINRKSNKVEVGNFPKAFSIDNIDKLVSDISAIKDEITKVEAEPEKDVRLLEELLAAVKNLPTEVPEMPEGVEEVTVKNLIDYTPELLAVIKAVKAIKLSCEPQINVKASDVIVKNDFATLENKLDLVTKAVQAISIVVPEQDDSEILSSLKKVSDAINSLRFPAPNYVLPYKNVEGAATQVQLNQDGSMPTANNQLPNAGNNPSGTISEIIVGNVITTTIQEVINSITYTQTIVEDYDTGITTYTEWTVL